MDDAEIAERLGDLFAGRRTRTRIQCPSCRGEARRWSKDDPSPRYVCTSCCAVLDKDGRVLHKAEDGHG